MKRTNVVLDEKLLKRAMKITGEPTMRTTIEHALKDVVRRHDQLKLLELKGIGWDGDLSEMRQAREFDS